MHFTSGVLLMVRLAGNFHILHSDFTNLPTRFPTTQAPTMPPTLPTPRPTPAPTQRDSLLCMHYLARHHKDTTNACPVWTTRTPCFACVFRHMHSITPDIKFEKAATCSRHVCKLSNRNFYFPSLAPSRAPTHTPTPAPTLGPTLQPWITNLISGSGLLDRSRQPTHTPTAAPTAYPTTSFPSSLPTFSPTLLPPIGHSSHPTASPTNSPTKGSQLPMADRPKAAPSPQPTQGPTISPTQHFDDDELNSQSGQGDDDIGGV